MMLKNHPQFGWLALLAALFLVGCGASGNKNDAPNPIATAAGDDAFAAVENARAKVDWVGIYQGIFPCAGCEGIATMLKINDDMTFLLRTRELGREDIDKKSEGRFTWLDDNSHIRLQGAQQNRVFRVGDGYLELMGTNGKPVSTANRENFMLEKTD